MYVYQECLIPDMVVACTAPTRLGGTFVAEYREKVSPYLLEKQPERRWVPGVCAGGGTVFTGLILREGMDDILHAEYLRDLETSAWRRTFSNPKLA